MLHRTLPELGEVLAGKYRLVRRIGEGGMGVVYEAVHTRIQQRFAVKMLLPEVLELPDVVSRFEREARAAGKLRSENTARVLDVDVSESGIPYMVMEFLDGTDLGKILEQGGALPIADAVDYVLQTCNAMAEAHAEGVIHRDLKPSNLFITTARQVKVLDFGISKLENDKEARVTATQTVVGTPLYMSPEQVRSAKHVDARTDIWSLGIILYELLAGRTPFEGSTTAAAAAICIDSPPPIGQFRQDVPAMLEQAILVALEKDPDRRFASVQQLAGTIAPFGSGSVRGPDTAPAAFPVPARSGPISPDASGPTIASGSADASGPALPRAASRPEPAHTAPGWTTRSTQGKRRTKRVVVAAFGLAGAVSLVVLGGVIARATHGGPATPSTASATATATEPATATATTATTAAAETPSASVSSSAAVPSTAVERTSPAPAHTQVRVRHHPTVKGAPTHTATQTVPAPAPTRL
jgi:serine/threonine protein kinase